MGFLNLVVVVIENIAEAWQRGAVLKVLPILNTSIPWRCALSGTEATTVAVQRWNFVHANRCHKSSTLQRCGSIFFLGTVARTLRRNCNNETDESEAGF